MSLIVFIISYYHSAPILVVPSTFYDTLFRRDDTSGRYYRVQIKNAFWKIQIPSLSEQY